MAYTEKTYQLDRFGVDSVSYDLQEWMDSINVNRRDALRIRLTMEELLLRIFERSDKEISATLRMGKRFGTPFIRFRYSGEKINPTEDQDDETDGWTDRILTNLGLTPSWRYRAGSNELTLRIPNVSHRSELLLLGALICAVVIGLLGSLIPNGAAVFMAENIFTPLSDAFLHLLNTFAPLLIFLSVATGICGIGSTADLGRVGKLMLTRFLLFSFLGCALITAIVRPFFFC